MQTKMEQGKRKRSGSTLLIRKVIDLVDKVLLSKDFKDVRKWALWIPGGEHPRLRQVPLQSRVGLCLAFCRLAARRWVWLQQNEGKRWVFGERIFIARAGGGPLLWRAFYVFGSSWSLSWMEWEVIGRLGAKVCLVTQSCSTPLRPHGL